MEFTVEQLQSLMKTAAEHQLGEFLYEQDGVKLRIKGTPAPAMVPVQTQTVSAAVVHTETELLAPAAPAPAQLIASPIVGTFYAAPAPDQPAFVKVGQRVNAGDVVFIIESMKVMNEVPADKSGVVAEILVESGTAVEYGQPILRLE